MFFGREAVPSKETSCRRIIRWSHATRGSRRQDLLAKEKTLTPLRDEKDYVFDAPEGSARLARFFAERSQLIVYHLTFDPAWGEPCKS